MEGLSAGREDGIDGLGSLRMMGDGAGCMQLIEHARKKNIAFLFSHIIVVLENERKKYQEKRSSGK
jgi:hypothetical protein